MRLFLGIFPPPEVRETLLRDARNVWVAGNLRWVHPANVHLTLKFLGEVEEESLQNLQTILGEVAGRHGPFNIQPSGLGAFPSPEKARVLWAGVDEGTSGLSGLAADLEHGLEPLGFEKEKKAYKPHATLARARGRPVRLPEKAGLRAPEFVAWRLDLIQSVPGAGGATYTTLESYPLRRGRDA